MVVIQGKGGDVLWEFGWFEVNGCNNYLYV